MGAKPFRIIPCAEWGARPPKSATIPTGRPVRALFHHTAGHALGSTDGESLAEAKAYCRSIQNYHMDTQGWNDSGQNFTVTRNGYIFEGRHGSLAACKAGKMVLSAHCPGQNDQPGVEIEHLGPEAMTQIQYEAAVWLFAQLCTWGGFKEIKGHRDFFATSCPAELYPVLPQFRKDVAKELIPPKPKEPRWRFTVIERDGKQTKGSTRTPRVTFDAQLARKPSSIYYEPLD